MICGFELMLHLNPVSNLAMAEEHHDKKEEWIYE